MDPSGAVGLDESPSAPPSPPLSPLPGPRSPRPLFYAGSLSEEETEEDSPLMGEAGDVGSSTGDPWTDPEPFGSLDDDEPSSSTVSPAGDLPGLVSQTGMRRTFREGVKTTTGVVHTVAAKTPEAQQVGLYLADDSDAKAIGDPLADIAYRNRGKVGLAGLSQDHNDLFRSLMGVGNYFAKQFVLLGQVRRLEAGATAAEVQHFPAGEVG